VKKYTINKSHNHTYINSRKDSNCISSKNSKEFSIDINNLSNLKSKNLRSSKLYKQNNDSKLINKIFLDGNNTNGNKLNYYMDLLENIKNIEPNLKQNKLFMYDYYKAVSIFYVESK